MTGNTYAIPVAFSKNQTDPLLHLVNNSLFFKY